LLIYQSEISEDISRYIYIQWIVTYRCNYKCDYCYLRNTNLLDKNKDVLPSVYTFGIKKLSSIIDVSNCRFDIMGGEPTLHADLDYLLDIACTSGFKEVNLNTNGSLLKEHINAISSYPNAKIILSYHPNKCTYNFIDLVSSIVDAQIPLEINVMFPPNTQQSYDTYNYLINNFKNIDVTVGLIMPITYTDIEYQVLMDLIHSNKHDNNRCFIFVYGDNVEKYTNEEIRLLSLNKFKDMHCFVRHFTIDPDGKIDVLCSQHILNSNFIWSKVAATHIKKVITDGITCKNDICGCSIGYNFKKMSMNYK